MRLEDLEESFFTCEACRYTFIANEDVERCPDCGKVKIRKASSKEIDEYKRIRLEIAQEENCR